MCQLTSSCSIRQFNKIFELAKKFTFKKSSGTGGFQIKFYLIFEGRERLSLIFCTTLYEIVSRVNCQDLRSKADSVTATLEEQLKPKAVSVCLHTSSPHVCTAAQDSEVSAVELLVHFPPWSFISLHHVHHFICHFELLVSPTPRLPGARGEQD